MPRYIRSVVDRNRFIDLDTGRYTDVDRDKFYQDLACEPPCKVLSLAEPDAAEIDARIRRSLVRGTVLGVAAGIVGGLLGSLLGLWLLSLVMS